MKDQKTQSLIEKLVKDHKAVKRDFAPLTRTVLFLYTTFFIVSLFLYFKTPFTFAFQNPTHILESVSLFIFINVFTYFGFESFVPGTNKKRSFFMAIGAFVFFILTLLLRSEYPQTYNLSRPFCEVEAIVISLITTLIGHFLIKKSDYAKNNFFSYGIFFALPMLATFFMHLTCNLTFWHVLECHVITPMLIPTIYFFIKK